MWKFYIGYGEVAGVTGVNSAHYPCLRVEQYSGLSLRTWHDAGLSLQLRHLHSVARELVSFRPCSWFLISCFANGNTFSPSLRTLFIEVVVVCASGNEPETQHERA